MAEFDVDEYQPKRAPIGAILSICMLVILLILSGCWGIPHYRVWEQGLAGEAELRRAEQNRRIRTLEAEAQRDAAQALALSEIERAKGVAEANKIIAQGLGGPEGYLRWMWIQGLQSNQMQVIYIPTEAGLPILEAGKR